MSWVLTEQEYPTLPASPSPLQWFPLVSLSGLLSHVCVHIHAKRNRDKLNTVLSAYGYWQTYLLEKCTGRAWWPNYMGGLVRFEPQKCCSHKSDNEFKRWEVGPADGWYWRALVRESMAHFDTRKIQWLWGVLGSVSWAGTGCPTRRLHQQRNVCGLTREFVNRAVDFPISFVTTLFTHSNNLVVTNTVYELFHH